MSDELVGFVPVFCIRISCKKYVSDFVFVSFPPCGDYLLGKSSIPCINGGVGDSGGAFSLSSVCSAGDS